MTDAGFEAVLMETRQVKAALKAMPIKTDRRDWQHTMPRSLSAQSSTTRPVSAFRYSTWVTMTASPSAGRSTTSTGLMGSWYPALFDALT